MLSFSSLVFSWRMRLLSLKNHKFTVILSIVLLFAILLFGPPVFKESWLDPFSTLNVPNRELHPRAINKLGMINSDDPFLPLYYTNEALIQELMRNLERSTPLSSSEPALLALENQKIMYFTLHREASRFHVEEDYALQYYPEKGIIRFGRQFFRINEASIYTFSQIASGMTTGWWK
ncbi:MAG: hypothetical protein APF81_18430 [Desulfosporosinus sp. BRH_c37]|nr:MAG: hypothetical protein APF81_18430 [Desulfosporosinus sp. BRH_c37]